MTEEQLAIISTIDWKDLSIRLKAYAVFRSKICFGKGREDLPKGHTIDDIVQNAIRRAFNRTQWPKFSIAIFEKYLFGAVKSILYNLRISGDAQLVSELVLDDGSNDEDEYGHIRRIEEHFEQLDIDHQIDHNNVINLISEKIEGDNTLKEVFAAILLGAEPREISEMTGIPINEVYNCKKKLHRIVDSIAETL